MLDLAALADEFERRGIKFADMPPGQYQMPSAVEMTAVLAAMRETDEVKRLRAALEAIQQATLTGKVCDDVAWFSDIETLHDFCDATLNPK